MAENESRALGVNARTLMLLGPSGVAGDIRAQALTGAQRGGTLAAMEALVDQCLADYDENGWAGEWR